MSKTVKLAFLASLVLNLLFLGVILGHAPRGSDSTAPRRQRMQDALKQLPEPAQTRLREKFQQIRAAGDPLRRQTAEARAEAIRLLSMEPFDAVAYDRQVSKIEELRVEMSKRMGQLIKQTARELSPDERRMLADVLRRPSPPS
jgi:uncharacterized membrane protein